MVSESHFLVLLPAFETDYILYCSVVLLGLVVVVAKSVPSSPF